MHFYISQDSKTSDVIDHVATVMDKIFETNSSFHVK